jgi:hypothetical protein
MVAIAIVGAALTLPNVWVEYTKGTPGSAWNWITLGVTSYSVALWAILRPRKRLAETPNQETDLFESCKSVISQSQSAGAERNEEWGALLANHSRVIRHYLSFIREAPARRANRDEGLSRVAGPANRGE